MKKLNLGCGEFHKKGYINVDFNSVRKPDVRHNLNRIPYPFKASEFDLIEADHVLEHLNEPFAVMRELHRIARPGAEIRIKVPHFSRGFTHPEHKRGFDVSFPLYFNKGFKGGYQEAEFSLKKMRMRWMGQPYLKRTLFPAPVFYLALMKAAIIDFLAKLYPYICSRIWCFWVGGFEEIEFVFEAKK